MILVLCKGCSWLQVYPRFVLLPSDKSDQSVVTPRTFSDDRKSNHKMVGGGLRLYHLGQTARPT